MIGRRGFFRAIGAGVLGMALALRAPERKVSKVSFGFKTVQHYDPSKVGQVSYFNVIVRDT